MISTPWARANSIVSPITADAIEKERRAVLRACRPPSRCPCAARRSAGRGRGGRRRACAGTPRGARPPPAVERSLEPIAERDEFGAERQRAGRGGDGEEASAGMPTRATVRWRTPAPRLGRVGRMRRSSSSTTVTGGWGMAREARERRRRGWVRAGWARVGGGLGEGGNRWAGVRLGWGRLGSGCGWGGGRLGWGRRSLVDQRSTAIRWMTKRSTLSDRRRSRRPRPRSQRSGRAAGRRGRGGSAGRPPTRGRVAGRRPTRREGGG